MLAASEKMDWRFRTALILAHETGHRSHSIRHLRWSDINFEKRTVRWEARYDKIGMGSETPLTVAAISALQEVRGIGDAWILPSPTDSTKPCSRHLLRDSWDRAQAEAGIPTHDEQGRPMRYGWHSLRRKMATDLLNADVPLRTITDLGGWREPMTVVRCYQKSTEEQQRKALDGRQRRLAE